MKFKTITVKGKEYIIGLKGITVEIHRTQDGIADWCGNGQWTGATIEARSGDFGKDAEEIYHQATMACFDLEELRP